MHTRNERELRIISTVTRPKQVPECTTYLGKELSLMDVQISAADAAGLDLDLFKRSTRISDRVVQELREPGEPYQDIVVTQSGERNLDNVKDLRLLVSMARKLWCQLWLHMIIRLLPPGPCWDETWRARMSHLW